MLAIEWLDAETSDMIDFLKAISASEGQLDLTREEWRARFFGQDFQHTLSFFDSDSPIDYIFPDSYASLRDVTTWFLPETTPHIDNVVVFPNPKSSEEEPQE